MRPFFQRRPIIILKRALNGLAPLGDFLITGQNQR